MDLRPRQRQTFSGFTSGEVQRMQHSLTEFKERALDGDYCKKLAGIFNRSSGRAGKPAISWTEIRTWFQKNQIGLFTDTSCNADTTPAVPPKALTQSTETGNLKLLEAEIDEDTSELEFEALSKDKAWYDVDTFLSHRYVASGELEVHVKYVGFGAEEAEWVNAKDSVRLRSVALDSSECYKVEAGDHVVCFKETEDKAGYYDAIVIDVERRLHDIRGCRCLFSIRYDHDNTEEKVRLRRLCCRPEMLGDEEDEEE
ncbi:Protein SAWADEE HOMEODOMAIN HOMOLOG 1 [Striga hermonthica]|uniref:Protein SAWADEE HOMEODOMAIN HOMOLOG 1 n=1 Tax=Striga hermonthica TaxID=68872 RepID=A0A9N7NUM5_STRHE|nr:Protein SAWADEE HOMEODOMAIN HOMOLOG 1 [Striga hermonthica]